MTLAEEIMGLITRRKRIAAPATPSSNLYTDLGFDSLAFVALLVELETCYGIRFQLEEMGGCLVLGHLVTLTRRKIKEAGRHQTPATATE